MLRSLCIVLAVVLSVDGHGRLIWPPGRSSLWRWGFDNPVNVDDAELYCGGASHLWNVNDGKCGVCGDPYDGERRNEAGGIYANGIIGATYEVGAAIPVTVDLIANHKGWFEYRLCPNNDYTKTITHDCLNQNLLSLGGAEAVHGTRYPLPDDSRRNFTVSVQLPAGLSCSQCVLQWKYNAGNSWGVDPDGTECLGCGEQEQFYSCADISIGDYTPSPTTAAGDTTTAAGDTTTAAPTTTAGIIVTQTTTEPTTATIVTTTTTATTTPPTGGSCYPTPEWETMPGMDQWCIDNCAIGNCPPDQCYCI
ncbi:unnamed protein product [Owenia fusiformis]|uniref:Uncharacterized protein n=1 Tax=Owenia fusiformis TaxID=6347 RepID=A0A8J1U2H7_OWEFU|nr:unnamed protein product [Owenia fusiformis]